MVTPFWRWWQARLALAACDASCPHCSKPATYWLCDACRAEWIQPVTAHAWPQLDTQVISMHPLAGVPKSRLYGAKFYRRSPWWTTAMLAEGLQTLIAQTDDSPITLITIQGRQKRHWMENVGVMLAVDGHHAHQTLTWRRKTLPQHTLPTPDDRWLNVENAFNLTAMPKTRLVVILDDVTTTGASLYHAAHTIRQSGYTHALHGLTGCYVPKPAAAEYK